MVIETYCDTLPYLINLSVSSEYTYIQNIVLFVFFTKVASSAEVATTRLSICTDFIGESGYDIAMIKVRNKKISRKCDLYLTNLRIHVPPNEVYQQLQQNPANSDFHRLQVYFMSSGNSLQTFTNDTGKF